MEGGTEGEREGGRKKMESCDRATKSLEMQERQNRRGQQNSAGETIPSA